MQPNARASLALSVKMSVLLYLPAVLLILFKRRGVVHSIRPLACILAVQYAVGAQFLHAHPASYLHRAFELGRVFLYKWTVNWRFLDESTFLDRRFAITLLIAHLTTLLLFAFRWCQSDGGILSLVTRGLQNPSKRASSKPLSTDGQCFVPLFAKYTNPSC